MEKLLNFNEPIDVNLLDSMVEALYGPDARARTAAQTILTQFQDHIEAWTRVDTILEHSKSINTKFYALGILESVIKYKWKALPREQCEGIKNYVVGLVIKMGSDEATMQREKAFLNKLNTCFVQIIKHEWPHNWPNFIPEIVASSKTNESLCENNMNILKSFSEEVFDFSAGHMTQAKIKELKQNFNKEFSLIYELCEYILERAQRPSLLLVTLETLLRFLNWIPVGYIFETKMIESLAVKFFPVPIFRNAALQCLTEIANLSIGNLYDPHFLKLFTLFMGQVSPILPPGTDIANAYNHGSESDQNFIHNLALFFLAFFRNHLTLVEKPDLHPTLIEAHMILVRIAQVQDVEVFKITLEYWNQLATDLHHESAFMTSPLLLGGMTMAMQSPRRTLYAPVLSKVRAVMVSRMAKPEEVLIVEDENGEIVREVMKDSDSINLYKSMRETLIFLTHLDYEDTQEIMLNKLAAQVDGTEWSWHNLNTLCWAIGSISGAMNEEFEKRFLVTVIKDLLGLVELKRGKDNKAVVASNIMYIVGQYPRFLRAHWKFLKTVVNKLFEFMHETHPGVQDMACDTFLKISQKCRRKFVIQQYGETCAFIDEILDNLHSTIQDLEQQQIHVFYEAVGYMISSHTDAQVREALIVKFMQLPNNQWREIMAQAGHQFDYLLIPETIKKVANILKVNVRAATSLGTHFASQMGRILMDVLSVYRVYSEHISNTVAKNGPSAARTSLLLNMRTVKKESLRLFETFIEKTEEPQVVYRNYVPPLLEAVLGDYKSNIPDARDPEVLSLMTIIINKVRDIITGDVPRILDAVFECTLSMITKNFEDYPEHRANFFHLLRAVNANCFAAFFVMPEQSFKLVLDSVVWAFKHAERNISETGLNILLELLHNISANENVSNAFYQKYFLSLLQDLFFVLTDSFHKSGFKLQATILQLMFAAVETGAVKVKLWDPATIQDPTMTNQRFLREYVVRFLQFPNMSPAQIRTFVNGLFDGNKDLTTFKAHLRDFLVQTKEFTNKDNAELYLEETEAAKAEELKRQMAVPGLIRPVDQPYSAAMDD